MKKGYYFTVDAMMAAAILATGLILASTMYVQESRTTNLLHYSQDLQGILSTVRLSELNVTLIANWSALGIVTDLNRTILEQVGEFWAAGNNSLAIELLHFTVGAVPPQFEYGIFFGGEQVYGSSVPASSSLVSTKRIVSGIAKGKPTSGFSSRAQLTSFQAKNSFAYAYFGGFTGQGNMSFRLVLPDSFVNVTNASLELDPSDNFTLYVNNKFAGYYSKGYAGGGLMRADKWTLNSSYLGYFTPGLNSFNITFNFTQGYIGGGFLRVTYVTSDINDSVINLVNGSTSDRYYFPGVNGLINIYDSFFVPGDLSTLTAHLHYNSSFNTFLSIGNATVFSLNSTGVQIVDLTNSNLASKLGYGSLSSTSVPVRLGSGTGNSTSIGMGNADVVLANDFSGSMEWCANAGCPFVLGFPRRICGTGPFFFPILGGALCNYTSENYSLADYGNNVCSLRWQAKCPANDARKIDIAINASRAFTTILLGSLGNKLGVVGYTDSGNFFKNLTGTFSLFNQGIVRAINLTDNAVAVDNFITTHMDTYWETCICCGVEASMKDIGNHSSPGRYKSIVVMSDGEANRRCYTTPGTALTDAINASKTACDVHNISVNTVAFGSSADTVTLKAMACNNGSFYNATNVSQLISAFTQIANQINTVSYTTQVVNFSGGLPGASLLFGDSYIEYNYTPNVISQFGVIPVTLETPRFGNDISQATFNLPSGTTLYQLKVTSYSSDKWTDNLTVSNSVPLRQAFSLQQFGSDYKVLGDPFVVYAKSSLFETGDNIMKVSTATSPGNYSGGSPDDLMLYTLLVPNSVPNGEAFSKADGCVWQVTFEDGSNATLLIPGSYTGSESCNFFPANFTADDAMDDAVYRLLKHLDFDGDGLLDIKFEAEELGVGIVTLSSVPSLWGPTVAESRVWQ